MTKSDLLKALGKKQREPGPREIAPTQDHFAAGQVIRLIVASRDNQLRVHAPTLIVPPAAIPFVL